MATLEQQLADGVPGVSQQDIDFLSLQIGDLESDDKWHQASVALAATNLASKSTALVQQAKTAASTTGTYKKIKKWDRHKFLIELLIF